MDEDEDDVRDARDGIRGHMLDYINYWRVASISADFHHIGFEELLQVGDALDAFEELLEHKLQQLPPLPILTYDDLRILSAELLIISRIFEKFCDRILIPLSFADENDLVLEDDFDLLNIRGSRFLFTYQGVPWLPDVTLLVEPFCWAWCATQLLRATYSFQHLRLGPALSMQCIINGVPNYAVPGDMNNINVDQGTYEATACIALRFVQKRSCDLDAHVPYVGQRQVEMPYLRIVEIQGDPFSIHPDSSIHSIRAAMEDFGCLVGAFEVDNTFDMYPGAPNVYFIAPAQGGVDPPLHYALICGVGSLDDADDGRPFLQIQNSFGTNWGDGGYGYIAKELFHHIHGLRGVTLLRE